MRARILLIQVPHFEERVFEGSLLHCGAGVAAHLIEARRIGDERRDGAKQCAVVACSDDEAGFARDDVLARAAHIGDDDWKAAGLSLEHDVAECVCGAREDEEIGSGEGCAEVVAIESACEDGGSSGEIGLHLIHIGAFADEGEVKCGMRLKKRLVNAREHVEVPRTGVTYVPGLYTSHRTPKYGFCDFGGGWVELNCRSDLWGAGANEVEVECVEGMTGEGHELKPFEKPG